VAFDHENFREFFLGEQIGLYVAGMVRPDLTKLLRVDLIPNWALETAVSVAVRRGVDAVKLIKFVIETAKCESPTSFVRENAGALCVMLLDRREHGHVVIDGLSFPNDFLRGRSLAEIEFRNCYFRPSDLEGLVLADVRFADCEFERLTLPETHRFSGVQMVRSVVHSLTLRRDESTFDIYDPESVQTHLESVGVSIADRKVVTTKVAEIAPTDIELDIVKKILHVFLRSTQVSKSVLTLRLGVHAPLFFSEIEEGLIAAGVLQYVQNRGGGQTERYRLGIPIRLASQALSIANGSYARFIEAVKSIKR
jgi:hypothetical protein